MLALLFISVSLLILAEGSKAVNIDCNHDVFITSPNYPELYPSRANEEWDISAPLGRRILVTFNEFILDNEQKQDYLDILDMTDTRIYRNYKGNNNDPSPFLSVANTVQISFVSKPTARSKGFNLTLSCFTPGPGLARIVDGPSHEEGILNIRPSSDDNGWRRVCSDGFQRNAAEVVCRELGYPGVLRISNSSLQCEHSDVCFLAPSCSEYTFRITDCNEEFILSSECVSKSSVNITCHKPGYKGCAKVKEEILQNVFHNDSVTNCVSTCKREPNYTLALTDGQQCVCATVVEDLSLDDSQCVGPSGAGTSEDGSTWLSTFNTTEGFCPILKAIENGTWDSNMTWFGSNVHLQCHPGHSPAGNVTLQCVPGDSPYQPVWNAPLPKCRMIPNNSAAKSRPELSALCLLVFLPVFVRLYVYYKKRKNKSTNAPQPETNDDGEDHEMTMTLQEEDKEDCLVATPTSTLPIL